FYRSICGTYGDRTRRKGDGRWAGARHWPGFTEPKHTTPRLSPALVLPSPKPRVTCIRVLTKVLIGTGEIRLNEFIADVSRKYGKSTEKSKACPQRYMRILLLCHIFRV